MLFYDGACPLCAKEIKLLKSCKSQRLSLVDIHSELLDGARMPNKTQLLQTLHIRKDNGQWVTGISANVLAWQYTKYGFLLRWLDWPIIKPVVGSVYAYWAKLRYQRNVKRGLYKNV